VLDNVASHPDDAKYRRLKLSNAKIRDHIVDTEGALQLLDAVGFRRSSVGGEPFATLPIGCPAAAASGAAAELRRGVSSPASVGAQPDRVTAVFVPSTDGPDLSRFAVDDSTFNVSGSDVRQMASIMSSKSKAEGEFRTKAMREKEARSNRRVYKRALVRVRFPDGTILQGQFLPGETVQKVCEFVAEALASQVPFTLLVHPGRVALADPAQSIRAAGLVPATMVNFRCEHEGFHPDLPGGGGSWLRSDLLDAASELGGEGVAVPHGVSVGKSHPAPTSAAPSAKKKSASGEDRAKAMQAKFLGKR